MLWWSPIVREPNPAVLAIRARSIISRGPSWRWVELMDTPSRMTRS
jgi:hypothetical protein